MKPNTITEWLANGERGMSSNAMCTIIHGIECRAEHSRDTYDHPFDPADLRRCLLFCEKTNVAVEDVRKMAVTSKAWAALVKHWEPLVAMFMREADRFCGGWRGKSWRCPETYKFMCHIRNEAENGGENGR